MKRAFRYAIYFISRTIGSEYPLGRDGHFSHIKKNVRFEKSLKKIPRSLPRVLRLFIVSRHVTKKSIMRLDGEDRSLPLFQSLPKQGFCDLELT